MLCQDSRITLLEVLNRPTTDVDFWTAFLRGKDGWLQPLKLYATYSGVEQLSGKTKTTWNRSALVEVSCGYQSQPLALCSNCFGSPIFLKCKCSQTHWHNFQAICFPNLSISIKHRQIGGQSVRFALHKRFSIEVGCRFAWHRIRWFQQSRDSLKGSGSGDVCQVSVGPTRASPLDALGCQHCHLTFKCDSIFQWLRIFGNV